MAATDTTSPADGVRKDPLTDGERGHMEAALKLLELCQHSQVIAIYNRLDSLLHPNAEQAAVAKAQAAVVELRKSQPQLGREAAMQQVLRQDQQLARELHDATRGARAAA